LINIEDGDVPLSEFSNSGRMRAPVGGAAARPAAARVVFFDTV
jgi:hypothetical protein